MRFGRPDLEWRPEGIANRYRSSPRPEVGQVVAYERAAWLVTHVDDCDLRPDEAEWAAEHARHRTPAPFRLVLRRLHGPRHPKENSAQDIGRRWNDLRGYGGHPWPAYADGRVPLCSCHGHPWPCLDADQQWVAEQAAKKAEKEMALLPGCCPSCQEPVTSRQKSITFWGPYLRNPLGPTDPAYHLRQSCRGAAARYEEEWVQADPPRPRSLLTLACDGIVTVHGDGTGECHGRPGGGDCPSVHARHRGYQACYVATHGCPQDCAAEGHPGTRVAGRPEDPRAVVGNHPGDPQAVIS